MVLRLLTVVETSGNKSSSELATEELLCIDLTVFGMLYMVGLESVHVGISLLIFCFSHLI